MCTNIDFLRNIYFFSTMPDESLRKIYALCTEIVIGPGSILFHEHTIGDSFFIILEGELEIWKRYGQPDSVLLGITSGGEAIGEMALIDSQPRSATVRSKTLVKALVVHATDFQQILATDTAMCLALLKTVTMMVRRSNESHINDLDRQNKELAKAYSELQALQEELVNRERLSVVGKFSSLILHDIRNPLSALKSRMELLELYYDNKEYCTSAIKKIHQDISRMEMLAAEFLDYARGEIRLNMSVCSLQSLFNRLGDIMVLRSPPHPVEFSVQNEVHSPVILDEDRMLRALINAAENAFKAMPDGGSLYLNARQLEDSILIEMTDTGTGMSPETLQHIFEPFYSSSAAGGTGLGMLIIKSIIDAHHGKITVFSEEGKGTTVRMELPVLAS